MTIKTISEGMTNAYLVHGFGVLALGGIAFIFSWMIAVPIIICSIGLFASVTGVQINTQTKEFRNYVSIFGYKLGSWKSLSDINRVTLILSTERSTISGIIPGAVPIGRSAEIQVRTYDLLLDDGIESFELNDFLTYKNARIAFDVLTQSLNINGRDYVSEKLAANRSKRSR